MRYLAILLFFIAHQVESQELPQHELKTTITDATVFLQNALITRAGKLEIPQGKSVIKIKALSPYIDEKSVQVKATGSFTILSVNHSFNYQQKLSKDEQVEDITNRISDLDREISNQLARLEVLAEKQSVLNENKDLGGGHSSATLTDLKQAMDFYDRELTAIKKEELDIKLKIRQLTGEKENLEKEIDSETAMKVMPTGEIIIKTEADSKTMGDFKVTYMVKNAGWYPKYDIRVNSVEKPLELNYKADIYQNTGVDWKDVKLKLSNGDPNQSGTAPRLNPWFLNYQRYTSFNAALYGARAYDSDEVIREVEGLVMDESGQPLPGVNVIVKGSTIGTVTDINGHYSLALPGSNSILIVSFIGFSSKEVPVNSSKLNISLSEDDADLSEVVVTGFNGTGLEGRVAGLKVRGYGSAAKINKSEYIGTSVVENQTTVEFKVDEPYSIKSNSDKLTVDLTSFYIETLFEYYAAPKLDKDAFLVARIIDWDQYNLLEGEANLYLEDTYVGRSVLNAKSLGDTLDISLGRDKSIVIVREKVKTFAKRKIIGSNKVDTREFKITVRNKKSQTINLTLTDQIPVSVNNDIQVEPVNVSNAKLDEITGELTWKLELSPQQQTELTMSYEVKSNKFQKLALE
ncbi:DUF4139 domain-containing protein [Fulvivirga ligni]|uniref:DUF4139 domain-containing protein n=1 Tax=Fulvivirga ligni TaxID=2904246 RepID=UPI001F1DB38E|nr:mucoidy inhibitor MuiA family protein [Fulvivirga ligni]UII23918.1 mucoidy inhibitor MuiA family protein [Fulvivirga ligni]